MSRETCHKALVPVDGVSPPAPAKDPEFQGCLSRVAVCKQRPRHFHLNSVDIKDQFRLFSVRNSSTMALCTRTVSARAVARPAARVASVKPVSRVIARSTPVSSEGCPEIEHRWRFLPQPGRMRARALRWWPQ